MFEEIDHAEVEELLHEVLDELHYSQGAPEMPAVQPGGPVISATVEVLGAGGGAGAVVVSTTSDGARPLGSMLLATPGDELTDEDLVDAVGELTNLLAGGVKSLVDEETSLGTPGSGEPYSAFPAVGLFEIEHPLISFSIALFNETVSAAA